MIKLVSVQAVPAVRRFLAYRKAEQPTRRDGS
jgi:hypothetical protein